MMKGDKEYLEFPTRIEEDGSKSVLVKGMYIKKTVQSKEGADIYGEFQGDPCVVTSINGELAVIVCKPAK